MKIRRAAAQPPESEMSPSASEPESSVADTAGRCPRDAELAGPLKDEELDFGSIRLTPMPEVELRLEVDDQTGEFSAIQAAIAGSSLQLQAFAAPKSAGIWGQVRSEIAASVESAGGSVVEQDGPCGLELLARIPGPEPTNFTPARFIGVDGPRWFLRAVLSGKIVTESEQSELDEVLASVVVARGGEPRAPRELLPLTLPGEIAKALEEQEAGFRPFERGPEITEVR